MEFCPDEVIEHILLGRSLDISDIRNFGLTCKRFQNITKRNIVLKSKYFLRFPSLNGRLDSENWLQVWIDTRNFHGKIKDMISGMSGKFFPILRKELTDLDIEEIIQLVDSKPCGYFLAETILVSRKKWNCDMTVEFYAERVLTVLHRRYLSEVWKEMINLPPEEQLPEDFAVFVTRWMAEYETHKFNNFVKKRLDELANKVKNDVIAFNPEHPLSVVDKEMFSKWRNSQLMNNQFSPYDCKQVLENVINIILRYFQKDVHMRMSCIYTSLETGEQTSLLKRIIFQAVARRLGVRCDILIFSGHLLLKWEENYSVLSQKHYIDIENGTMFTRGCPRSDFSYSSQCPTSNGNIVERLVLDGRATENIEERIGLVELILLAVPSKLVMYSELTDIYFSNYMNIDSLKQRLQNLDRSNANFVTSELYNINKKQKKQVQPEMTPKRRMSGVDFCIGMVGYHIKFHYYCVIFGWDEVCKASEGWKTCMGVMNLPLQDKQPFYNVVAADNSIRYVAQENLCIATSFPTLAIRDLGFYFKRIDGGYFMPNDTLTNAYPEDYQTAKCYYEFLEERKR